MNKVIKDRSAWIYYILGIYAILCMITIIIFNGTGNSGDSINHYLFAKHAPFHIENFFDLWAKPIFVLLSFPFAQLGFTGIKLFNVIVSLITIYLTFRVAQLLKYKNTLVVAVILIFTPLYYIITFTGLTEPLFALVLVSGIFFILKEKKTTGYILISFLPFVRTEGLLFLLVFGIYIIYHKEYRYFWALATGHIAYSLTGYFVHGSLFWVFSKVPYATLGSVYGSGELTHYAEQLLYVTGIPIFVFFWIGFLVLLIKIIKKKSVPAESILVFLGFVIYFLAHTMFWYLGIFNSMGLKRVLIGVVPLIALMALLGYNFITETLTGLHKKIGMTLKILILAYILVFPFTSNPAAINWKKDMKKTAEEHVAEDLSVFIKENNLDHHLMIYDAPYLGIALNIDPFDLNESILLRPGILNELKSGDIIIWDSWYSVVDFGITREKLEQQVDLKLIKEFPVNEKGRINKYVVYQVN